MKKTDKCKAIWNEMHVSVTFVTLQKENKETKLFKDESKKWNILKNGRNIFLTD